jgi:DNA-binding beta-propeller fold protein YncE
VKIGTRLGTLALAATAAVIGVGCSAGGPNPTGRVAASPTLQSSPTPTATLPNPFTITARFSASTLGLKQPVALAIGPDGNLYGTDGRRPSVSVISPRGKVLRRWGRAGRGPGQFRFVGLDRIDASDLHASIAVGPGGRVYVSDGLNHRVQVFSSTGKFGYNGTYQIVDTQTFTTTDGIDRLTVRYRIEGRRLTLTIIEENGQVPSGWGALFFFNGLQAAPYLKLG